VWRDAKRPLVGGELCDGQDRQREWRSDEADRDDRGRERGAQEARPEPGFQRDGASREQHRKGVGEVIGLAAQHDHRAESDCEIAAGQPNGATA
jgi:hypothetical protein